jgi:thiamine-phosphate pyrophosphorylase
VISTAVDAGIPLIQIREKRLPGRTLFDLVTRAKAITCGSRTLLLVNDRVDIAIAAGADGVHLTANSVDAGVVRKVVPEKFIIGVSAHSIDELSSAQNSRADLAVFGPIFDSPGKGDPLGIDILKSAIHAVRPFPVVALGGIDQANYHDIIRAGAAGFAAIRLLNNTANLEKLSLEFDL